mmetsp:Transcript_43037/g.31018  ORF Transcript_43037/g.31018 Transcript_43037/m.31018 type:complete len:129 (-) Transcript_43037:1294-1680(-)
MLAVLYFFIGVGSLMSAACLKKLGTKTCLVLGGLGHFIFVFASILPAYSHEHPDASSFLLNRGFIKFALLFSSMLNGLGASILWVAEGNYLSQCATESTKGFFFSYFWFILMLSQVFGNFIGAVIMGG